MKNLLFAAALVLAACGGDNPGGGADMAHALDLTIVSNCGHPGDVGNSFGVGKFCEHQSDCAGTSHPTLCTQLGDPNNYFCTIMCSGPDAGASECGEAASCACSGGQCGCFPDACK